MRPPFFSALLFSLPAAEPRNHAPPLFFFFFSPPLNPSAHIDRDDRILIPLRGGRGSGSPPLFFFFFFFGSVLLSVFIYISFFLFSLLPVPFFFFFFFLTRGLRTAVRASDPPPFSLPELCEKKDTGTLSFFLFSRAPAAACKASIESCFLFFL